jgi:hypothetical protein
MSSDQDWLDYQKAQQEYRTANDNIAFGVGSFGLSCLGTMIMGVNPSETEPFYIVGQVSIGISIIICIPLIIVAVRKKSKVKLAYRRLNGR